MTIPVTFRVVGIYCYFQTLQVPVEPTATVKEVMEAIQNMGLRFSFETNSTGSFVNKLSYDYQSNGNHPSKRPSNTSRQNLDGSHSIEESGNGNVSTVWQYYRSTTVKIGGSPFEIKTITPGQPSFATTSLNKDVNIPSGSSIQAYNLTWRLVSIVGSGK
ncbi:MAG: hypothetical protein F6K61_09755 [Sphaerospermopsis sp. SIO1G1]|nr:hypothetical protein [Sphaerospermopsis sp. SIO1G1]